MDAFSSVSDADLDYLIVALRSGRLAPPFAAVQISRWFPSSQVQAAVRHVLLDLNSAGFTCEQIAKSLEMIAVDRKAYKQSETSIDLVTSGPEAPGITNRDTSVVVREMFAHANDSVLVVGYAIRQGRRVFEALANRMNDRPNLLVRLFLNIARQDQSNEHSQIVISKFKQRFKDQEWPPGCRLPEVYYDPRSVADDEPVRSSLHAKCVVVDVADVFVSSANLTEAGQERNIEVGLKMSNPRLAKKLARHFQLLHEHGLAVRAF